MKKPNRAAWGLAAILALVLLGGMSMMQTRGVLLGSVGGAGANSREWRMNGPSPSA